jgi:peptidoglycan/LPS O-acetylase OafA/YrhL
VEEQFYLFWPFVILSFRKRLGVLQWIVFSVILFSYLQYFFKIIPSLSAFTWVGIIEQSYALSIGSLGAIVIHKLNRQFNFFKLIWVEYAAIIILMFFMLTQLPLKYVFCPLISLYLVIKAFHYDFQIKPLRFFLNHKFVVYLGSISYGIYLFHLPLGYYITKYVFDPYFWNRIDFARFGFLKIVEWNAWIIKFPLFTLLSFSLAYLSYRYIESPILKLKDRYFRYK